MITFIPACQLVHNSDSVIEVSEESELYRCNMTDSEL